MSGLVVTLPPTAEGGGDGGSNPPLVLPPSVQVFFYRADALGTSPQDPGAATIRWNNEVQQEATELYVDWLTTEGFDAHLMYEMMQRPTTLIVQDKDIAVIHQVFRLVEVIPSTDWFILQVEFVSQSGPSGNGSLKHNANVAILAVSGTPASLRLL